MECQNLFTLIPFDQNRFVLAIVAQSHLHRLVEVVLPVLQADVRAELGNADVQHRSEYVQHGYASHALHTPTHDGRVVAAVDGELGRILSFDHTVHLPLHHRKQVVREAVQALRRVVNHRELVHAVVVHRGEDVVNGLGNLQQMTVPRHHVVKHVRPFQMRGYKSTQEKNRTIGEVGELLADNAVVVRFHLLQV